MENTNANNNLTGSYPDPNLTPQPIPESSPTSQASPAPQPSLAPQVDPNPQPIPNPQIVPEPQPALNQPINTPQKPKTALIAIIIIVLLGIIGGLVCYFITNQQPSSQTNNGGNSSQQQTKFEDLTKDEAIAFLKSRAGSVYSVPDGYVNDEIKNVVVTEGNTIISDLELIDSYDNLDDLKQLAIEKYNKYKIFSPDDEVETEFTDFTMTEYDYYAIVTPNHLRRCDYNHYSRCDSLLSFRRKYVNRKTDTMSPKVFALNTTDPEIANYLLRVLTFCGVFNGRYGNIYSYSFEDQDDKFVLTANIVGAGINMELYEATQAGTIDTSKYTSADAIAINLYHQRLAANKSDGELNMIPTKTGIMDYIKSIPITEEEFKDLKAVMHGEG